MSNITIRDVAAPDFEAIVALNTSAVQHTSPMDIEHLRRLDSISGYHKAAVVENVVAGFLLVMPAGCEYCNDNFEWFSSRYDSFLYVDRIVIGDNYQGLKLGTRLYSDLFTFARSSNIANIVCEYNLVPPNEASRLFHERFSFSEVGSQWLNNGKKKVSLQLAQVKNRGYLV